MSESSCEAPSAKTMVSATGIKELALETLQGEQEQHEDDRLPQGIGDHVHRPVHQITAIIEDVHRDALWQD